MYSCVAQPNIKDGVIFSTNSFAENWRAMLDDLTARGMHRLMVEPGAKLARELFNAESSENSQPLWNRLD